MLGGSIAVDYYGKSIKREGDKLVSIMVDFVLIASSAALAFYQALNSIVVFQYAGAGFQHSNRSLIESVVLLVIFFFSIYRLVIDLRSREKF